jgi:hypothetical protein
MGTALTLDERAEWIGVAESCRLEQERDYARMRGVRWEAPVVKHVTPAAHIGQVSVGAMARALDTCSIGILRVARECAVEEAGARRALRTASREGPDRRRPHPSVLGRVHVPRARHCPIAIPRVARENAVEEAGARRALRTASREGPDRRRPHRSVLGRVHVPRARHCSICILRVARECAVEEVGQRRHSSAPHSRRVQRRGRRSYRRGSMPSCRSQASREVRRLADAPGRVAFSSPTTLRPHNAVEAQAAGRPERVARIRRVGAEPGVSDPYVYKATDSAHSCSRSSSPHQRRATRRSRLQYCAA